MRAVRIWRMVITAFLACDSLQPLYSFSLWAANVCMLQSQANKLTCLNCVCDERTLAIHLATISALCLAHFVFLCYEGQHLSFSQPSATLCLLHSVYLQTCPSYSPSKTQRTSTFRLIFFIMYNEVVASHLFRLFCYHRDQPCFCVWIELCCWKCDKIVVNCLAGNIHR